LGGIPTKPEKGARPHTTVSQSQLADSTSILIQHADPATIGLILDLAMKLGASVTPDKAAGLIAALRRQASRRPTFSDQ